jgi:hypothetical protein
MRTGVVMLTIAVLGFVAGVSAQRAAGSVTMQGRVMDANTLREEIEYWELRGSAGETIVISGRNDVPVIKWLRQAKGSPAQLTFDRATSASDAVSRHE